MQQLLDHSIFIVDDDPFTGLLYKKHLSNLGFTALHHFLSGVDCLDNLYQNPRIILLDHQMARVTGFEVLKEIKNYNPEIVVIMVSGQEDMATAVNALKHGAFDYIIKDGNERTHIEAALQRLANLKTSNPNPVRSALQKLIGRK